MSRRDNGLPAAAYSKVVDIETHLVDGLLERLRDEDVAAYVAPAQGRRGAYGDTVLPRTPSDSLYVDSDRQAEAWAIVERYLTEVREELAWASIVADFDSSPGVGSPAWPVSEDVDRDADAFPTPPAVPGRSLPSAGAVVSGPRDYVPPDEHFEPPPPPPLPVPDTINRFAWAGALGGPLLLILATILDFDFGGWAGLLGLTAFVGGFVTLVARMKDRPPPGLDGDDGAVV